MTDYQLYTTGTLSDANLSDEITTTALGSLFFCSISLADLQNGDDFDIQLQSWDSLAYQDYINYNITMAGGDISFDTGAGAAIVWLTDLAFENVYLDSTYRLRLVLTRNSGVNRSFPYYYNLLE